MILFQFIQSFETLLFIYTMEAPIIEKGKSHMSMKNISWVLIVQSFFNVNVVQIPKTEITMSVI